MMMVATDAARRREIGRRIRAARVEARLTQAQLGERLGVAVETVKEIEAGAREISIGRAILIAKAVGVTVTDLLPEGNDA